MDKLENILLNLLYQEWLNTHDPHDDDFEDFIWKKTGRGIIMLTDGEFVFKD